jgi:hypothetical protein
MVVGNEVTLWSLSGTTGAGVNRMDHREGFFKKQMPLGKPEDTLT